MSLIATGDPWSTAILTVGSFAAKEFLPGILGGDENIARSLSKQVGFQVAQKDADLVRSRLARGLDPRTGQPTGGTVPGVPTAQGVSARTTGIGDLFRGVVSSVAGRGLRNIGLNLTDGQIREAINRPATGTAPAPRGGPTPTQLGFPTASRKTVTAPASPRTPRRRMIPPTPPGGRMSLIGAAGMSGLPAVVRGGAGLARTATGRIGRIFLPSGAAVSKRDAVGLIRKVGFEAAAIALGITAIEAAELFLQESARKRRGRGITAAQVRNARRTTCMVARLARDLGIKAAPVRRRKTCRS